MHIHPFILCCACGLLWLGGGSLSCAGQWTADFETPAALHDFCLPAGGRDGGAGEVRVVTAGPGQPVHSGTQAVCLAIYDNQQPQALAWAGLVKYLPCHGGEKVCAQAWVRAGTTPGGMVSRRAQAQIRIEYYNDSPHRDCIASRLCLSQAYSPALQPAPGWQALEAQGRVPAEARLVRVEVLFIGQELQGFRQQLWMDDLSVTLTERRCPARTGPSR